MGAEVAQISIAWSDHEGPRVARKAGFDIIHCEMCGFRHAVPLPRATELARTYREVAYADDAPAVPAADDPPWQEIAQQDRLEGLERVLGPGRRRLLDVGCGPGHFLKTARTRGWRAIGIEPSRRAAAQARNAGLEVVEGFFGPEVAAGLGRFDAISLSHVLERVADPVAVLIAARDILEPGGALCVTVPNDFSPFQIAAAATAATGEWWLALPQHLNYFDFATLVNLLERLDFAVAEKTTSFPMEAFLLMGDNYRADPAVGRACHNRRKRFDLALDSAGLKEARRSFYRALAETGIGRDAIVIAVKP